MTQLRFEDTVGRIATEHPASIRVFQRYRIDFCCGGREALSQACGERGLDPASVALEIEAEEARTPERRVRWDERPLPAVIDHILARYHRPLDTELPRLIEMAEAIARVHGPKDPAFLDGIASRVRTVCEDLQQHLRQEEDVVFPMLRGVGASASGGSVALLTREHEAVGAMLDSLRRDTDDFTPPEEACATWRALYEGLEMLERDCHEHIHLENNVLFPRAMAG